MSCFVSHTSIDCADAYALSEWWKVVLGYVDDPDDPNEPGHDECWIQRPDGSDPLLFIEVPEAQQEGKQVKNRIHLDLAPGGVPAEQRLGELLAHGARELGRHGDDGSGGWVVLADPEGNELCLLDGTATLRPHDGPHDDGSHAYLECTTVDSLDPLAQARWWREVLAYAEHPDHPHEPGQDEYLLVRPDLGHELLFVAVPEPKEVKNRVHLDLCPSEVTRDVEVERLLAHGARAVQDLRVPDGRGWMTLADPEGNEFCVLRGPADAARGGASAAT